MGHERITSIFYPFIIFCGIAIVLSGVYVFIMNLYLLNLVKKTNKKFSDSLRSPTFGNLKTFAWWRFLLNNNDLGSEKILRIKQKMRYSMILIITAFIGANVAFFIMLALLNMFGY